jgi:beta-lactamase class A
MPLVGSCAARIDLPSVLRCLRAAAVRLCSPSTMSPRKPRAAAPRSAAPPDAPPRPVGAAVVVAAAALFALGVALGGFMFGESRACMAQYAYVNGLLACGRGPVIEKRAWDRFRDELLATLRARADDGALTSASVFFRDLANGPTFGIDEFAQFVPASLLKLPLVLAYLVVEERTPGFLEEPLVYRMPADVPAQSIRPTVDLEEGATYPTAALLASTLKHSDNTAYLVLLRHLRTVQAGDGFLLQIYRELGIVEPRDQLDETVTVRGYASLFRLLYNASYLSPELSERALSWLAASEFGDGLVGGVPAGTVVAHKFGERTVGPPEVPSPAQQLHDCGIVYYPGNPYLLCVMTRGSDLAALAHVVRLVSRMVYDEVESRRPAARLLPRNLQ